MSGSELMITKLKGRANNFLWVGILLIIIGIVSVIYPGLTTLSITIFAGILLLITGFVSLITSFSISGTGPFFGSLLLAFIKIFSGIIMLRNPLLGMVFLTSLLGIVFLFEGAFEMTLAFELKPLSGWGWTLFSGMLSIVAGIVIITNLNESSLWLLGLMFGVNFISSGISSTIVSKRIKDL